MEEKPNIARKVPINWSVLRERVGTCSDCKRSRKFKFWLQWDYRNRILKCAFCGKKLDISGAVKDFFKEKFHRDEYPV